MLVLITDIAIKAPKKYEPPSPRKIDALGKLYFRNIVNIKIKHNVGTSVNTKSIAEKEKLNNLYNWHFIWSKFYYFKKHYGFLISMLYFLPI